MFRGECESVDLGVGYGLRDEDGHGPPARADLEDAVPWLDVSFADDVSELAELGFMELIGGIGTSVVVIVLVGSGTF